MATIAMWSIKYIILAGWLAGIVSNLPSLSKLPQQNFAWYKRENERIAARWICTSLDKFIMIYIDIYRAYMIAMLFLYEVSLPGFQACPHQKVPP